tara:strand:+ start:483 stop:1097 length:615 start_codon:yes stop_codon:yes gene_type:complete
MQNKFLLLIFSLFSYFVILLSVYFVHINFFEVKVILYSAILDSFIALFIFFAFSFFYKSIIINSFEFILIMIICILFGYSFSISLPTVIDRSLSFYFLEKIEQHNGAINKTSMKDIFINDYIDEYKLIEVRITEQLESGTIQIDDSCIYLTRRGYMVAKFSNFFRKNFLAKNRLILEEYSDQLTDPLRRSQINNEYLCQNDDKK